jgi:multiple sugar transport system permease protein
MIWKDLQSKPQRLVFINGLIPIILIILFVFATNGFFPIGYLLYGWLEILGLSTFVSMVPGIAQWYLFGISLVGAQETANITMSFLILIASLLLLFGSTISLQTNKDEVIRGRIYWLIGGLLTFPLGLLSLYAYRKTRPKDQDISFRDRFIGELRKNKLPYLLIIPALIFLVFTYIIPILRGLYITLFAFPEAVQGFTPIDYLKDPLLWTLHAIFAGFQQQDPTFIGIDNYLELFSNTTNASSFQNALNNNVYFVILFVPGVILVSLALALLLNNKLLKGENSYTTIFYMPVITSVLVVSVIWLRVVFPNDGLLTNLVNIFAPIFNGLLGILSTITFGIVPSTPLATSINWLDVAMIESVVTMSIWRSVGFDVLILLAGLKSIPSSLYEAADIDGHGSWSKFKNITLPMLKGPLGVVIILELINGWQIFQEFYGLNLAQYGGDQSLAIYLVSNFSDIKVMTFASTVGYFIFGMTAFIGLLGRVEIKGLLKGFALFSLLAILFSIPANRANTLPKSLGFTLPWLSYDLFFLVLALLCLFYYFYDSLIKRRELEDDTSDLRQVGYFVLFIVPFYLLNGVGFNVAGLLLPSPLIGLFILFVAILMILSTQLTRFIKRRQLLSFLFPVAEINGV